MTQQALFGPGTRILFLTRSGDAARHQLAGGAPAPAAPLRDDISTDEITPVWTCLYCDPRIGDHVYLGLRCDDGSFPFAKGTVRAGGFAVSVAGARRGKGSSREASPYAELAAGIRAVFATSFERIYRQNCQNLGLLTSTDFALLARIARGDTVTLDDFTTGLDPVTADIVRSGGLFAYNRRRLACQVSAPRPDATPRPLSLAEKIVARACGAAAAAVGDPVFVRPDWRFSYEFTTPLAATLMHDALGAGARIRDPGSVRFFRDHLTFIDQAMPAQQRALGLLDTAHELSRAQARFAAEQGVQLDGELPDRVGSEGICHSLMAERYTLPGQLVVGTDSHTPHSGALGALAFGIGTTEMANAWAHGDLRMALPAGVLVQLDGMLPPGVAAKDIALALLALPFFRDGRAVGRIVEFAGPVVAALDTDERATLTNMTAEMGGFSGIVTPDAETARFLRERRGIDWAPEPWMASDAGAVYESRVVLDCSAIEPLVARPGDPGRGVPVGDLPEAVAIDIAYGGSCTGGKREDMRRYHAVLEWALDNGRGIAPGVAFYLQFGSLDTRLWCEQQGYIDTFRRAGVQLVEPGCGACINAGPGASTAAAQTTVSAINRNFPGRSGPGAVWLASPATVAASAIAGRLTSFAALIASHTTTTRRPT